MIRLFCNSSPVSSHLELLIENTVLNPESPFVPIFSELIYFSTDSPIFRKHFWPGETVSHITRRQSLVYFPLASCNNLGMSPGFSGRRWPLCPVAAVGITCGNCAWGGRRTCAVIHICLYFSGIKEGYASGKGSGLPLRESHRRFQVRHR